MSKQIEDVTLRAIFDEANKSTHKGFNLLTKGKSPYIYLRIPLFRGDTQRSTNQPVTATGINEAKNIAHETYEVIKNNDCPIDEFNHWWQERTKSKRIATASLTIADAIKKVSEDYWAGYDKQKRKRSRSIASHRSTFNRCYFSFYKHLPQHERNLLSPTKLFDVLLLKYGDKRGTKQFKEATNAYAKLFRATERTQSLGKFLALVGDTTQTEFREVQHLNRLELFNYLKEAKKRQKHVTIPWVNVFCIQILYGLRISEVYAIANLSNEYTTEDGYKFGSVFDALTEDDDLPNIFIQGKYTIDGEVWLTTKTGERVARPILSDDIAYHELITPVLSRIPLPLFEGEIIPETVANHARRALLMLTDGQYSQTHALRHLANYHAKIAGLTAEQRALTMGHSVEQNRGYDKHLGTQETVNLLGVKHEG